MSTKPTGPNQYRYEYVSYTKMDILNMVSESGVLDPDTLEVLGGLALTHAIEYLCLKACEDLVPVVGVLFDAAALMEALTSYEKKALIKTMYEFVKDKPNNSGVIVKYTFKSFQKGSQGFFWNPNGQAEIIGYMYGNENQG